MKRITLFLIVFSLAASCSLFKSDSESVVLDSPPPKNYNPVFITQLDDFESNPKDSLSVEISSVKFNGNKTSLNVHIIDSMNTLLTGAAGKKIWCEVIDSSESGEIEITSSIKEILAKDNSPISMAIVMDHSGSMGEERAREMQKAVAELIENKRDNDKIALIRYDEKIGVHSQLSSDKDQLLSKHNINGLQGYGTLTATRDGILKGIEVLKNEPMEYSRAVIVFTDGMDNSSISTVDSVVATARKSDVLVSTVDYGYNVEKGMLKDIAEKSSGIYHHIYLTHEFDYLFEDIYTRLNNFYLIEYDTKEFGYHKVKLKLCIEDKEYYTEYEYDNTPQVGQMTLLNVYFDHDKASLKKDSREVVKMLAGYLKKNPNLKIELHGHTDNTGNPDYNQSLSERRAETVKKAIVSQGIDENRISYTGHGDKKPIADNNSNEGRAKNRRTEFLLK